MAMTIWRNCERVSKVSRQIPARTRFPEELWLAAAEIAKRRGVNLVCRSLRLAANSLKKWMGERASKGEPTRRQKRAAIATPAFMELIVRHQWGQRTARWKWKHLREGSCV